MTEFYVKVSRFKDKDEDSVEDPRTLVLAPPGVSVDAGVADLLSSVVIPAREGAGFRVSISR